MALCRASNSSLILTKMFADAAAVVRRFWFVVAVGVAVQAVQSNRTVADLMAFCYVICVMRRERFWFWVLRERGGSGIGVWRENAAGKSR